MRSWASSTICLSRVKDPILSIRCGRPGPCGRAHTVSDRLIREARPQDLTYLFEDDTVRDPWPVATQRVNGIIDWAVQKQRRELLHNGSSSRDGMAGTGIPVITERRELR